MEDDLEDGEIEDDDDDEQLNIEETKELEKKAEQLTEQIANTVEPPVVNENLPPSKTSESKEKSRSGRSERHHKYESKSSRKRGYEPDDDWACDVEKAIASALKKDRDHRTDGSACEEDEDVRKKGKKRKKKDRDREKRKKHKKTDEEPASNIPLEEEIDEDELLCIRGGSPKQAAPPTDVSPSYREGSPFDPFGGETYESYDSEYDSDSYANRQKKTHERERERKRDRSSRNREGSRRERKNYKEKNREKRSERNRSPPQDANSVCLFYMQGKCHKGEECPYSHAAMPPMKLELCKFYLMDCCAKRDKCLYMHSEFPCKYYHTGLRCVAGERGQCKFAHGTPLSENLKQVLLKHLETAPKEILGDFPRLSREGAQHLVNATQKKLEEQMDPSKSKTSNSTSSSGKSAIPSLFDITVPMPAQLMQMQLQQNVGESSHDMKSPPSQSSSSNPTKVETKSPRSRPSRWNNENERVILPPTLINPVALNTGFASSVFDNLTVQDQQKIHNYQMTFGFKGLYSEKDQDMRVTSNGDVDMRSLNIPPAAAQSLAASNSDKPSDAFVIEGSSSTAQNNEALKICDSDDRVLPRSPERTVDKTEPVKLSENTDADDELIKAVYDQDMRFDLNDCEDLVIDNSQDDNLEIDEPLEEKEEEKTEPSKKEEDDIPNNLPTKQRELFMRIKAQQKDHVQIDDESRRSNDDSDKDAWYSSDDENESLTKMLNELKSDKNENVKSEPEQTRPVEPLTIKPVEMLDKLGDLSKIDISAEVTKLLSLVKSKSLSSSPSTSEETKLPSDPRIHSRTRDPRSTQKETTGSTTEPKAPTAPIDPRMKKKSQPTEHDNKPDRRLSIYEIGSLEPTGPVKGDVDLRNLSSLGGAKDLDMRVTSYGDTDLRQGGRSDVDLRQLNLPFKPIPNYVPATEIDASINSHGPITYKVHICDIPRPDYSGLKLNAQDAQVTSDPRLRKIFRLSSVQDEPSSTDLVTIASPPPTTKHSSSGTRIDPRMQRKSQTKLEMSAPSTLDQSSSSSTNGSSLNYNQQIQLLQNSQFYQSLTSNQKLILNQAIANKKSEQDSIQNDPVLAGILANLGLTSSVSTLQGINPVMAVMSMLNLGSNFNPMNLGQMSANPLAPSLLGPGPSPMNLMNQMAPLGPMPAAGPEFPNMGFDPRNTGAGLLGHSPFQSNMSGNFGGPNDGQDFGQFGNDGQFFNGNDPDGFQFVNRNERGSFRGERSNRRGGRGGGNWNNSANSRNSRNFGPRSGNRNNRSNRTHSPP